VIFSLLTPRPVNNQFARCVAVPIAAGKALGAGNIENIAKTSNAASGDWDCNPKGKGNWVVHSKKA
jgi:hypothetical protein